MVLATIDGGGESLTCAVAGHPPPLLWNGTEVLRLAATGPPVGLLPVSAWTMRHAAFPPGAMLVAYTDGVTEALDAEGEEYGMTRLAATVESLGRSGITAQALLDELMADLRAWTRDVEWSDDVSLVVVRNGR